jgi:N-acetylmuramoyl-L-alanine amidase
MNISNHRIEGVPFVSSPNIGGVISPKFIVMHYTASWTANSAINTLKNPKNKVSAHVVVDVDGKITQLVPFNVKAWHAGPSSYEGYTNLNDHSIGIEIVNIGFLRKVGETRYQDHTGSVVTITEDILKAPYPRAGSGDFYWPIYQKAQLDAVETLSRKLIEIYGIIDIVTHEEIDTRGWKTDPGPAFPMNRFKNLLNERSDEVLVYDVISDTPLNVRSGPGTEFGVVFQFVKGTVLMIQEFKGNWARIDNDHWVHKSFIRKI